MSRIRDAIDPKVLNASLLIAATAIGLSYFTMPILTGIAGFIPAILMTLFIWLFTQALALLFVEVILGQPDGANIISLSRLLLGKTWMVILAVVVCINMIGFLTGYAYFMEKFFIWFFEIYFHLHLSIFLSSLLSTLPFLLILFLGVACALYVNIFFALGLLGTLFLAVYFGRSYVVTNHLLESHFTYIFFSVPTLFSTFGYLNVLPPLCTYLHREPRKIRYSILIGSSLVMIVYLFWQWLILGSNNPASFWVAFEKGVSIEQIFSMMQRVPYLNTCLNFILFFSMSTSFIGNGTAFVELICDGLGLQIDKRTGWNRFYICLFILILVLPFSLVPGSPFLTLLRKFITPLGEVLIIGIVPAWMAAQARYVRAYAMPVMLRGGKISLFILGVALFLLIYLEGIVFIRS